MRRVRASRWTSRTKAWTRPRAWASRARSTWKRRCARTTGCAAADSGRNTLRIACVSHFADLGGHWELRIVAPRELARFLAYKGSIAVNGVSLTVNRVVDAIAAQDAPEGCEFSINLIPHTLQQTTLGTLTVGARVNLEVDLIARYVERMLGLGGA